MNFPRTTAQIHTLDHGLTIILDPHHDHPVISTQLFVSTGSIHEDHLLGSGLSHFLEHMVFKGTKNFSSDRLASVVQGAGGHWNAYTSFDRTVYYIDGPSSGTETFLRVLTDMVFRPTLPEAEFSLEKDVIRREIDMGLDDPQNASMRLLLETAFRADPRRQPVIGHRSLFDGIKHADLLHYHRTRYTPDRCFLIISGDFSTKEIIPLIEELTADLSRGHSFEPFIARDSPQFSCRRAENNFAIPHTKLIMAWKIPASGHADMPAFEILSMMLGSGQSSHLYRELREKQELVYEIGAFTWSNPISEGLLGIAAECAPDQRDQVVAAILKEISLYHDEKFMDALARAKRQLMVSQFRSLTTASGRATDLASNWHEARDLDYTVHFLEAVEKVTAEDIRRCCKQLADHNLTITLLNPENDEAMINTQKGLQTSSDFQLVQLDNGLEIALFPDHRTPLISIQTAVRGGLSTVLPEQAGIVPLLACTLDEGTQTRNSWDIASTLEGLGASLGATSGNNSVIVSASGLATDVETLLEMLADILLNPTFPEDALRRNQLSQLNSLRESQQDPLSTCMHQLRELMFGQHTYGLPSHGIESTLTALGREELLNYHQKHFTARNSKMAIAGDFDPDEITSLLKKHFSAMREGEAVSVPASSLQPSLTKTVHREKKQAVLAVGYPGLSANDERRFASMMLMEYCSDMAGPLFTRIREELGLAYQVGAFEFHGHDTGLMAFYLSTSPEQLNLAHRELEQQLRNIAEVGIPEENFENVRATVLSALVLRQQSPGAMARQVAVDLLFGESATHHREIHQKIERLNPSDVRDLAKSLLIKNAAVTSIVEPS